MGDPIREFAQFPQLSPTACAGLDVGFNLAPTRRGQFIVDEETKLPLDLFAVHFSSPLVTAQAAILVGQTLVDWDAILFVRCMGKSVPSI